jgi:hypothetical protein
MSSVNETVFGRYLLTEEPVRLTEVHVPELRLSSLKSTKSRQFRSAGVVSL